MASYTYECINSSGEIVRGTMSANSVFEASARLKENGLTALSVDEIAEKGNSAKKMGSAKKVKIADLSIFSRQLAAMLGAGVPVTRAISTLGKQQVNPTMKYALETIAHDIEGGVSLTDAFAKHPKVFNELYVAMIKAGEVGGILEEVLNRLSLQLQKDKQLKDNIKSATAYPKVVGIFAVFMFIGMLVLLVPIFEGMMPANAEIPAISAMIFGLSASIRGFWYIWLVAMVGIVIGIVMFFKSPTGRALWESQKIKLPIISPIIVRTVIARLCRTLATLLEGGIPVVQALNTAGPTAGSDVLKAILVDACKQIEEGKNISEPLEKSGFFPPMVTQMISIGEESGTLPELLDKVAEFYEEDVASLSKQLSTVLEPIMLIGIGGLVGVMLISLYLPMFTSMVANA